MLSLKYFFKFLIIVTLASCAINDESKQKEIEALEKEKNDVLKQIHTAIDDSVTLLKKDNSTQNVHGVNYMLELKQQLQSINETDEENVESIEDDSEIENRRKMKNSKSNLKIKRPIFKSKHATTLGKEFDINRILFGKKFSAEKIKELMQSRVLMQKKLDDWILQREMEKAKIRERLLANQKLLQSGLLEKCPRFGFRKKKKKFRRTDIKDEDRHGSCEHKEKRKKQKRTGKTYPCCRKCCKKSYMGCL